MNYDLSPINPQDKQRANDLASKLGIKIPGDIHVYLWSLTILEEMVKRIEELEKANENNPH